MQAARRLLDDTDLPVATVSHRVGYRDVSYFIRRFRPVTSMIPVSDDVATGWRSTGFRRMHASTRRSPMAVAMATTV